MRRQIRRSNHIRIEGSERIRPAQCGPSHHLPLSRATSVLEVNSILVKNFIKMVYSREEKVQNVKEDSAATLVSVSNVCLHFVL
ncbi:hypothetical protein NQ318_006386 [Aromia moschata]|uniref:Uncharacterized protein n=1 Tax=Aromia moschata TaxID=1265417 RepID=A0AAV8YGX2_9CUCU|nr:hypothetical protein NQ318_006386 [Aromia moschata]